MLLLEGAALGTAAVAAAVVADARISAGTTTVAMATKNRRPAVEDGVGCLCWSLSSGFLSM